MDQLKKCYMLRLKKNWVWTVSHNRGKFNDEITPRLKHTGAGILSMVLASAAINIMHDIVFAYLMEMWYVVRYRMLLYENYLWLIKLFFVLRRQILVPILMAANFLSR